MCLSCTLSQDCAAACHTECECNRALDVQVKAGISTALLGMHRHTVGAEHLHYVAGL